MTAMYFPKASASDELRVRDDVPQGHVDPDRHSEVIRLSELRRQFDSLVGGLGIDGQPRVDESPKRRRPTATRRGPIAAPSRVQRPTLRATGVAGPRVAAPPVRQAVRHDARPGARRSTAGTRSRAAATGPATWRLTDRGVAVVMLIGLVLMVASAVAVVSTAITVTSEDYRPTAGVQQQA